MKQINHQEIMEYSLEILRRFDMLCSEHGLRYSVAYGTMIGCVRHHGYIPWDDDIDVIMPRSDYEKLLKLKFHEGDFEIRHYSYTDGYFYPFAKMTNNGFLLCENNRCEKDMGIFIDIFPLDFIPCNEDFIKIEKSTKKHGEKLLLLGLSKFDPNRSLFNRIKRISFYCLINPLRKILLKLGEQKFYCAESNGSDLLMNQFFIVKKGKCHSIKDWDSIIRMKFENIEVSVLSNYDAILRGIYGDYMKLPPVEEQVSPHQIKVWKK